MTTNKNWMTLERAREIAAQIEVMRGGVAKLKSTTDRLGVTEEVSATAVRAIRENNDQWDSLGNQLLDCLESVTKTCVHLLEREGGP